MSTDVLSFVGYAELKSGDVTTVWRNDWCVGQIWKDGPASFSVRLNLGNTPENYRGIGSREDAEKKAVEAFEAWCASTHLLIEGMSLTPAADPSRAILDKVKTKTARAKAIEYMQSAEVQRHLAEMGDKLRQSVRALAMEHIRTLPEVVDE